MVRPTPTPDFEDSDIYTTGSGTFKSGRAFRLTVPRGVTVQELLGLSRYIATLAEGIIERTPAAREATRIVLPDKEVIQ